MSRPDPGGPPGRPASTPSTGRADRLSLPAAACQPAVPAAGRQDSAPGPARRLAAIVATHPRHALLFAAVAGLLLGPWSRAATVLAAGGTAALVAVALRHGGGDGADVSGPSLPAPRLLAAGVAAAVLAGAVLADARADALGGGRLPSLHGRSLTAAATLLEPVRERVTGIAVARARLSGGPAPGEVAVLRVPVTAHPGAWPGVGQVVRVAGRVAPLGRYDAYQARRGAGAALDVARLRAVGARRGGLIGMVDAARRRAEAGLARGLSAPEAALLRGMVLGQDERLGEDVREAFERSGLAHILAVSGQNVMLLATLVLALGAATGLPLRARLLVALALIALYVPLTGAGPSIQRAGVMGAAGLVAALAGRPAHRWYALALAAAVTLALNPRAAAEPGWQLSFAAVVSLLAAAPGLRARLARRLPGPVADVAAITASATLGTAPLMAFHFGQVSLASLPANLVAAVAIGPIMWLGMLAAAVAQVAPVLAEPLNALNAPLLAFVSGVARTAASAPLAAVPVRLGSLAGLGLAYATLAIGLRAAAAAWRRPDADAPPVRRVWGWPALVVVLAGVAVAVWVAVAPGDGRAPLVRGELAVSFLDIGQGDATLLQRDGAAILVDTGPPDGPILRRLAEAGVGRLDALVLTHAQADHEGAALAVMRAHPPRLVVNGGAGWDSSVQRALPAAARAAGSRLVEAVAGRTLTVAGIRLDLLWPPPPEPGVEPHGDPNNTAIVAHVRVGDFDLLLPADAESDVTARLRVPEVEVLKIAHHGSADAGLPDLLDRARPSVAAIEVGRGNPYGHPAPSTLAALRGVGQVVRTDRDGTVRVLVRADRMRVERGR